MSKPDQMELLVYTPSVITPGARAGEWIVRQGKPVMLADEISIAEASKITGLSARRLQTICDEGVQLKPGIDWNRPGGPKGKYFLKRASVIAMKFDVKE